MPLYELSDKQVNDLRAIIANSDIKGGVAPLIVDLLNAISKPVKPEKPEKK